MSARGILLFDNYVASALNDPRLSALGLSTHVFNLTSEASKARIAVAEITEEVGPLHAALAARKK